jgi:hypothetical protein
MIFPMKGRLSMSTVAGQYSPHEQLEVEDRRVAQWRFDQLQSLGFDDEQASLLAASGADLHRARSLVGAGCPLHLALRILA